MAERRETEKMKKMWKKNLEEDEEDKRSWSAV